MQIKRDIFFFLQLFDEELDSEFLDGKNNHLCR